jgi:DDE family transposase
LATICGAEHFTELEEQSKANEGWQRAFLKSPNGIPSHDTFEFDCGGNGARS